MITRNIMFLMFYAYPLLESFVTSNALLCYLESYYYNCL